jgi:hypothetical protein
VVLAVLAVELGRAVAGQELAVATRALFHVAIFVVKPADGRAAVVTSRAGFRPVAKPGLLALGDRGIFLGTEPDRLRVARVGAIHVAVAPLVDCHYTPMM